MGPGHRAGDVGEAAGSGVRGVWEEEGRKETLVLIAGAHSVLCWLLYMIYLRETVILLGLGPRLREVKSTVPWTHSDGGGGLQQRAEGISQPLI